MARRYYAPEEPDELSNVERGLRSAQLLQQLAAPFIQQAQQKKAKEAADLEKAQDFQRQLQLRQAFGEIGPVHTTAINQAQGDRPASIGAMPVQEGQPADLTPVSPGVFISPTEQRAFKQQGAQAASEADFENFARRKRLESMLEGQKPFTLNPGEQRYAFDEKEGQIKPQFGLPGKAAEPKTYTLSPGQRVFDAQGKEIASLPATEKQSKPIVVAPGSTVIDENGKQIFNNPINPKEEKKSPADKSFATNVDSYLRHAKELEQVVKNFGGYEGGVPLISDPDATAALPRLAYSMAIEYAKLKDPESVAREGEVASAQKYLIPYGMGTRNSVTLAAIKQQKKDIEALRDARAKASGNSQSQESTTENSDIPSVNSKSDYDKLPSGAIYLEDGVQYRKP